MDGPARLLSWRGGLIKTHEFTRRPVYCSRHINQLFFSIFFCLHGEIDKIGICVGLNDALGCCETGISECK